MIVVVEGPAARDLVDLSAEISRLSEAARARSLPAGAFGGQSFTVSNIGAVGGGYGTPIVPYGTTGILSVGRAEEQPIARAGRLEIAPMMPLSLSYDHRVIDGSAGRRFLATVVENLEEPTLFLA
jgi:pyruvate dehydrogenase E2 component (dihydrolipoamide acetyltransferase)